MVSFSVKIAKGLVALAVGKISRGSQSWPSTRWETESSMPSFLRGESHSQTATLSQGVLLFFREMGASGAAHRERQRGSFGPPLSSPAGCLRRIQMRLSLLFREDQVNFRGFMRTLAHFRPIEDNEKNKNPTAEPLNSRTNKLLCE